MTRYGVIVSRMKSSIAYLASKSDPFLLNAPYPLPQPISLSKGMAHHWYNGAT
jgi:hypothetical protein